MAVQAFLLGFAAALLTLVTGLAVMLFRLKRRRAGRLAIRGDLGLIPDLSDGARGTVGGLGRRYGGCGPGRQGLHWSGRPLHQAHGD